MLFSNYRSVIKFCKSNYEYMCPVFIKFIELEMMRWIGCMARMGEKRNVCRILGGKPQGKGPL
jgi:hypothetical protein